ncbi:hypothetical protein Ait01nite_068520 [Actinoplanes italicus]|uniref:Uncharacterized protein n=1 Tax=Actinoplanes italicus TaxID=113567 RepID=A0A2T0K1C5_9ACTN|nr:ankyrin repeat domain-containing protein [Actinoplanes italicus]PRX16599.1 hypothetical protein CLV67_119180 [Actinoplanes italicus]GIE33807.1 hypothetical protein Ait01nite_068520 [Actinoplanes italicus]
MWLEIVLVVVMGSVVMAAVVVTIMGFHRLAAAERATAERRRRDEELRARVAAMVDGAVAPEEVGLQNPDGDSALHLAWHAGREDAVARLVALGADENLRNNDGLTPAEMVDLVAVERLLEQTLPHLIGCRWRDREKARPFYDSLQRTPARLYNPALVRVALRVAKHRSLVCLAVKVGAPGSEERLASLLDAHGTKEIATDYLNAGTPLLAEAARRWAAANGYVIEQTGSVAAVRWATF